MKATHPRDACLDLATDLAFAAFAMRELAADYNLELSERFTARLTELAGTELAGCHVFLLNIALGEFTGATMSKVAPAMVPLAEQVIFWSGSLREALASTGRDLEHVDRLRARLKDLAAEPEFAGQSIVMAVALATFTANMLKLAAGAFDAAHQGLDS